MSEKTEKLERKIYSEIEVLNHIHATQFELPDTPLQPMCVDGRQAEKFNGFGRPGGSAGSVLELYAGLDMSHIELSDADILTILEKIHGGSLAACSTHTDVHATASDMPFAGCGHINNALHDTEAYGIRPELLPRIKKILSEIAEQGAENRAILPENPVIPVDHLEGAVVVISGPGSERYSIKPTLIENNTFATQVFVYHQELHLRRLQRIAEYVTELKQLSEEESELLKKNLVAAAEKQVTETVRRLALDKGCTVYTAMLDKNNIFQLEHKAA